MSERVFNTAGDKLTRRFKTAHICLKIRYYKITAYYQTREPALQNVRNINEINKMIIHIEISET